MLLHRGILLSNLVAVSWRGYYTPAESFILERVREEIMDEMDAVPEDYSDIRAQMAKCTREQKQISRRTRLPRSCTASCRKASDAICARGARRKSEYGTECYANFTRCTRHRRNCSRLWRHQSRRLTRTGPDGTRVSERAAGQF